jgi:hypothetical protein
MMQPLALGICFFILAAVLQSYFELTMLKAVLITACIVFAPSFYKGLREGMAEDPDPSDQK